MVYIDGHRNKNRDINLCGWDYYLVCYNNRLWYGQMNVIKPSKKYIVRAKVTKIIRAIPPKIYGTKNVGNCEVDK